MNENKEGEQPATTGVPDPLAEAIGMNQELASATESTNPATPTTSSIEIAQEDEVTEAEDSDARVEVDRSKIQTGNLNVRMMEAYSEPLAKQHRIPKEDAIDVPSVPPTELNAVIDSYPQEDFANSEYGQQWVASLAQSQMLLNNGDALYKNQLVEGTEWVQRVEIEDQRYGIVQPRFGDDKEGGLLVGDRAVQRMNQALGLGAQRKIPLWHSGIWLTLKAPTDAEILELDRLVNTDKAIIGRTTHGMLFSNTSVVVNTHLVNFILRHVYSASVPFGDAMELKDVILLSDLPTLIWGIMCTIYPAGFPYTRACITGPDKCQHQVTENLMISKLNWVNHRALSQDQKSLMKNRNGKFTLEQVKKYQSAHHFKVSNTITLDEGVTAVLRSPTLNDYERSGMEWVETLERSVDETFGGRLSAEERSRYIISQAQATAIRHYSHYIDKLVIRNDQADADNTIESREVVEQTASAMSGDNTIYQKLVDGVGAFIEGTTISMIAIPRYNCPACDHDQGVIPNPDNEAEITKVNLKANPILIPLDTVSLFFTLTGRRLSRVLSKRMV